MKKILLVLTMCLLSTSVYANKYSVKTYIPPNAFQYLSTIESETKRLKAPVNPWYVAALFEHESCLSLRHSKCFTSKIGINNSRERSTGFIQLTKAFRKNGTVRFDTLTELVKKHQEELKGLTWKTSKYRDDLQLKAGILLIKDYWWKIRGAATPLDHLMFTDSSVNGGLSGLNKERTYCGLKKGCDASKWLGNVERMTNAKSTRKSRYGRSFWQINRHHVKDVIFTRQPKYKKHFTGDSSATIEQPETIKNTPVIKKPKPKVKTPKKPESDYWQDIFKYFGI